MTKLEKLYQLADTEGILIYFLDLKEIGVLGLNVEKEGMPYMIFLDCSLKDNTLLHLEVLAHELGHYFTLVGNLVEPSNYTEKLYTAKYEYKAEKWACEYLITEKEIADIINSGIDCAHEMAIKLEVSGDLLNKRLEYLSKENNSIHIGGNKYLALTNLPNFYMYDVLTYSIC